MAILKEFDLDIPYYDTGTMEDIQKKVEKICYITTELRRFYEYKSGRDHCFT